MRLFILSDLHLERRALESIAVEASFDALVCAGDLWEGEPRAGVRAVAALSRGRPAVIVPGNHDHYRSGPTDPRAWPDLLAEQGEEAERLGIAVLRGGASVEIAGVRFVGATLWSDWALAARWAPPGGAADAVAEASARVLDARTGSREYRGAILGADGRPWSPRDAMAAHERDKAALAAALAAPFAGPTVAVTHHPPLVEIVDPYRGEPGVPWWLPAFYGTRALAELPEAARPAVWVSGHFHAGHDVMAGRTRCVANPVEGRTYRPDLVVEV
ncbi:metallophosphoesterase family protein [Salinarimonas soli]|uniref:Metallophosphoesterase n=1 Tax=Salinarimonas soli TaxID=1638099 RepID=A0A5B2VFV3_9HYPH|nr:metallophosphoesterase [Salinarimonas soli]KAA2237476.1 metallophosphoesterase [Salinarimonas soli]